MKLRIIITIYLLAMALCAIRILDGIAWPTTSQDLAIQQLQEDGSRNLLRIQEAAQNWGDVTVWGITGFFTVTVWWPYIQTRFKREEAR